MQLKRLYFVVLVLTFIITTAAAQETEVIALESLPPEVKLEGFSWVHQGVNRCSAAALTIHLSYYMDVTVDTYFQLANHDLNSYGADASVRLEEMAFQAEKRGLNAIVRRGGTIDLLRQLIAGGFPVLVENVYYAGDDLYRDWLSHNRVLIGYNDTTRTFIFQDPLLGFPGGQEVTYEYDEFDKRWMPFNRDYMIFYTDEETAQLQAILGEQWDAEYNARWTLEMTQREIESEGRNLSHLHFNLGWAQLQLGMYEEAAASFDTAMSIGLPMRMLWYEFGPFEAFNAVGRYQDTISLANTNINVAGNTISIEEWYYYAAQAYEGMNNLERAMLNYELALVRNANFFEAADRLQELRG